MPAMPSAASDISILFKQGLAHQHLGQLEQALGWLEQAAQVQADHAILQNNLGNILLALGRLEQAVAAFDRAVALKPDYAAAFHRRAWPEKGWAGWKKR